jgi:acetyltransferase-like isoleucine patch superfamily enzyme
LEGWKVGEVKELGRQLVQRVARTWFFARLAWGYRVWGMDEVNRALLRCRPAYVADVLRRYGATVGVEHDLYAPLAIHNAFGTGRLGGYHNLRIGDGCHVGKEVFLDLMDRIEIGDRVTISMGVMILTHTDVGRSPLRAEAMPPTRAPVVVKEGAYVGARATLLQGVTVGAAAVVAAGALVVDDVPPGGVVGGVPARTLKPAAGVRTNQPSGTFRGSRQAAEMAVSAGEGIESLEVARS